MEGADKLLEISIQIMLLVSSDTQINLLLQSRPLKEQNTIYFKGLLWEFILVEKPRLQLTWKGFDAGEEKRQYPLGFVGRDVYCAYTGSTISNYHIQMPLYTSQKTYDQSRAKYHTLSK